MKKAIIISLLYAVACGGRADEPYTFVRPPDPWPGPTGAVVYVEGEDFIVDGDGWEVQTMRRRNYGEWAAARMQVLSGRYAGDTEPFRSVVVPENGDYLLWVRFSRWPADVAAQRGPFRVSVEQDGRIVAETVFDEDPFDQPYNRPVYTTVLVWGASTSSVPLQAGTATIRLAKVGPERVRPQTRRVDCVLLTTDAGYEPDERDFAPQTYVRFRPESASIDEGYFQIFMRFMRRPWFHHIAVDRQGVHRSTRSRPDNFFRVGEETPWVNLSRHLYSDSPAKCTVQFTARYPSAAEAADYSMDFAPLPDPSAIVKTLRREGSGGRMQMTVPPDLSGDEMPMADIEYAEAHLEMVSKLPPVEFGRRATRFPLTVARRASDSGNTPGVADIELKAKELIGFNGLRNPTTEHDLSYGLRFGRRGQQIWFMKDGGYNNPDIERMTARIKQGAESFRAMPESERERVKYIRLMDEASATRLRTMADRELDQQTFRQWLKDRDLGPDALGVASEDDIRLVADRDVEPSELYYWSQRFRTWTVANFFLRARRIIAEHYPEGADALVTQNYSDGAVYHANMYSQGNDYYVWFKELQALGIAKSADWVNHGSTWQLCGWNAALMRSATRYHGQPIVTPVISSFGRRPLDVKLKSMSNIAQGSKLLFFYDYAPIYRTNSSVFGHLPEILAAIAEIIREVGAAEDLLMEAMPRRAETAILYSIPYDIWNVGHDNSLGHERMFTYLALRHAQIPVDIISDDDVFETGLEGYRTIYAFGEQVNALALQPLAEWVREGGTLVLSPGALSADEYNRPADGLDAGLGLERGEADLLQRFWHASRLACERLKSHGSVTLTGGTNETVVPILSRFQTFSLPEEGADVLALFEDGEPAAASLPVGEGRVFMNGFLPAVAYMQAAYNHYAVGEGAETVGDLGEEDFTESRARGPAADDMVAPLAYVARAMAATSYDPDMSDPDAIRIPRSRYSACPFAYSPELRRFIVAPALEAGGQRPVRTDHPVIEATFMESDEGWVVPLANYTGAPLDKVAVTIEPGRPCGPVFSSREGELQARKQGNAIVLSLPLESTDFLYAFWE